MKQLCDKAVALTVRRYWLWLALKPLFELYVPPDSSWIEQLESGRLSELLTVAVRVCAPDDRVLLPRLKKICEGKAPDEEDRILFDSFRGAVCRANGYRPPEPGTDPALLKAVEYLRKRDMPRLDYSIEDMVWSVAVNSGISAEQIYDLTVVEFNRLRDAVNRSINYKIFALAELCGADYRRGNPYPTWLLNRREELPPGFERLPADENGKELI